MIQTSKKLLFLVIFVFLLAACEFTASTANIDGVQLAKDSEGAQPATTFEPTDTVYSLVTLANAPDSTALKAVWTVVDVGEVAPAGEMIDEVEIEAGSGTHYFNLTPSSPFPAGSYKVDIYLNEELTETLEFNVAGEVAQAEEPAAEGQEPAAEEEQPPASSGGAVSSLEEVESATIRITSQGTFEDPDFGTQMNSAGQGSGFIIDPSGIAVTNNHVVTGAAFLQVWLEGDTEPRNARLLGVSECSDLAVIDIDGDGYPYLEWVDGNLDVGLEVYAAGFPLFGNEEYTLTRGIISKAQADGESSWASVENVLEIDAAILGGNSGGPLVTGDGQLVGVNYAGNDETRQNFSISRDTAVPVIDILRQGQDVNSIGINGQAILFDDGSSGIWVSNVASGSPADQAGIMAGDFLTHLEGFALATDGTMSDYCNILRSHTADDVMSIQVFRFGSDEFLDGQLNGEPLQQMVELDLGDDVQETVDSYGDYVGISDDTGDLTVEVPAVWTDINGSGWVVDDQEIGPALSAAPDLEAYTSTWNAPGMFFGASDLDELASDKFGVLDAYDFSSDCTYDGRVDYDDGLYFGAYDVWADCAGTGNVFVVLSATPEDERYLVMVQAMVTSSADEEALDRILSTFLVSE